MHVGGRGYYGMCKVVDGVCNVEEVGMIESEYGEI